MKAERPPKTKRGKQLLDKFGARYIMNGQQADDAARYMKWYIEHCGEFIRSAAELHKSK